MRELDRLKVIHDEVDGSLKPLRVAERLGLTTWRIRQLVGRFRQDGVQGLVSCQRSKPSNNRLDRVTVDRALSIVRERYTDFGSTRPARCCWNATESGWPGKRSRSS